MTLASAPSLYPSQPDVVWLTLLAAGGCAMLVTVIVGHGVLRPLLEARGIAPWTVRDSVGSLMLVVLGSGLFAGGLAAFVACRAFHSGLGLFDVLCLAAFAAGALMMRLGLLALRKLT
jgi:hypothetical protein